MKCLSRVGQNRRASSCADPVRVEQGRSARVESPAAELWRNSGHTPGDFADSMAHDVMRSGQTPMLIMPGDTPAHPHAVCMEVSALAPNDLIPQGGATHTRLPPGAATRHISPLRRAVRHRPTAPPSHRAGGRGSRWVDGGVQDRSGESARVLRSPVDRGATHFREGLRRCQFGFRQDL
jgi:hypothetical protein